jgi:predicted ATPase
MELLEREHFFHELEALLGAVAAGNGRLVLVGGEAGIGKTSLVERFAETQKARARVLHLAERTSIFCSTAASLPPELLPQR